MTEGGDAVAVAQRLRAAGSVFAEEEAEAILSSAATPAQVERWVAQRCAGEPLEHVVGWVEFYQQRISIDPGVFVPRRRTELMVREAVSLASRGLSARGATGTLRERVTVVDLCCGSAAVGVATAGALADEGYLVDLRAADLDPIAVACAHRNVAPLGARAYRGDLFDALPTDLAGLLDVVTANTPYVQIGRAHV